MSSEQSDLGLVESPEPQNPQSDKAHPWRICPIGKHYVKTHSLHIPPSKEHPQGQIVTRHEHCADNLSHKDELSYHEIQYITETYFNKLSNLPTAGLLKKIFPNADKYDSQIYGWVKYWNDIFQPDHPLDANFVKALIGIESSFIEDPKKIHSAHGLMQIQNDTFLILQNPKGELTNYLIRIHRSELLDTSTNICMGVRWLFQKRKLASARLKRAASWEEAVIEYKDYWKAINTGGMPKGISDLRKYYEILQEK